MSDSRRLSRMLLVDDHDLFRSGLRMIVELLPQAHSTVHEASTGEDSIAVVREHPIDIVFMDYSLPGLDGISSAMRLLQIKEDLKIIILTGIETRPVSNVVLRAGICGYMTKASATEEIGEAIDCVMLGGTYLSRDIGVQMALGSLKKTDKKDPLKNLSRRELQVTLLLMNGHKPGAVGDMLYLSPKSVSTYKRRAFEKLNVDSLIELAEVGRDCGFINGHEQRG